MKITYRSGSKTNGIKRLVVDVTRRRFFGLGSEYTLTVEYVCPPSSVDTGINVDWFEMPQWKKADHPAWGILKNLWLYHVTMKGMKP